MLGPIYRLLQKDQVAEAINRLEDYLTRSGSSPDVLHKLRVIKVKWQKAENNHRQGLLADEELRTQQAHLREALLELIRGLEQVQQQQSPPVVGAPAPPPAKGNILNRAIDALKDRFQRPKTKPASRPPSPRIPARREGNEKVSDPGSELPNESAPIDEEPMETSAPAPPAEPSTSPTQIGGTQNPFQKGKILYAIPPNMKLAETVRCVIRIATENLEDTIMESGLSEEEKENATKEGIRITSVMKVELVEAQGQDPSFKILARNTSEQPILPFLPTEWTFDVTPKRPGHYALLLRVTAKVQIPGFGERPFDVAVLDRAIQVTTSGEAVNADLFEEQAIPDPNWDETDEQAVHQALLLGRVDRAIERIINFVQDKNSEFHNTLLLLQFRWSDNSNQLERQLITTSDWDKVNNQVRLAITKLLAELRQHFSAPTATSSVDWQTLNTDLQAELK